MSETIIPKAVGKINTVTEAIRNDDWQTAEEALLAGLWFSASYPRAEYGFAESARRTVTRLWNTQIEVQND